MGFVFDGGGDGLRLPHIHIKELYKVNGACFYICIYSEFLCIALLAYPVKRTPRCAQNQHRKHPHNIKRTRTYFTSCDLQQLLCGRQQSF